MQPMDYIKNRFFRRFLNLKLSRLPCRYTKKKKNRKLQTAEELNTIFSPPPAQSYGAIGTGKNELRGGDEQLCPNTFNFSIFQV